MLKAIYSLHKSLISGDNRPCTVQATNICYESSHPMSYVPLTPDFREGSLDKPCNVLPHLGQTIAVPVTETVRSRHINPTKTDNPPPTTNTLIEVIHSKTDPAVVAQTQAPARPHDDRPRRALAYHALRAFGTHAARPRGPAAVNTCPSPSVLPTRHRGAAAREDDLLQHRRFLGGCHGVEGVRGEGEAGW